MEIAVSQVATGKANKNYKLFGRLCHHKDVCMCGFGALGFYLLYRFECTGEFEKSTVDFTKAEEWFDIKMLVSLHNFQESQFKGIKDATYTEYVKSILTVLGLPTSSQLHLGRKMGAVHCEMMELGATLTKTLGNWNSQVFDKAYLAKIPLQAMCGAAQYSEGGGIFYCPRTAVITNTLEQMEDELWQWADLSLAFYCVCFLDLHEKNKACYFSRCSIYDGVSSGTCTPSLVSVTNVPNGSLQKV
jgi:Centromere DNA-binding protein complex CBF3 subunit, domain 2